MERAMSLLAVVLELRNDVSIFDYKPLFRELEKFSATRVQDSLYVMKAARTPREIVDNLCRFLDTEDSLVAFAVHGKVWCTHPVHGAERWLSVPSEFPVSR
jgi:CRISPR/Cas system-associated endoribonuclease Cas2